MRLIRPPATAVWLLLLTSSAAAGLSVRQARARSASPLPHAETTRSAPSQPRPQLPTTRIRRDRIAGTHVQAPARPAYVHPDVQRWQRIFRRDSSTARALSRMSAYAPLIRHELAKRGVPQDFIYLPLIESEYRPEAVSHAGAAGMWQLMPGTARAYGLEVSAWVDERHDPVRSTFAAVRHLSDLHRELGSWHLAAAAYNCGSTRLRRAVTTSRGDAAYWLDRDRLPRETREYLPKLIAAIQLGRATEERPGALLPLRFREITVPGGVQLETVALASRVPTETIVALNPHLVRRATPPGRSWPVRIPAPSP